VERDGKEWHSVSTAILVVVVVVVVVNVIRNAP